MTKIDFNKVRSFGTAVDFGKTAEDYGTFRAGFPERFFNELTARGYIDAGEQALDIGTGTGTVALGLAKRDLGVTGLDPAEALLKTARELAKQKNLPAEFMVGKAEALPFEDASFHLVSAGQCWHWFDRPKAATEAWRVLMPGGRIIIAHFDWLPIKGSVVEATEKLIMEANPDWTLAGGNGFYPDWLADLSNEGFREIETFSFDEPVFYSHEAWRGRIRASAGIRATLNSDQTISFDERLGRVLASDFPDDPLAVPHRIWAVTALKSDKR